MAKSLEAKFYFAHPDAWWERGLNENINGLVRQDLLKSTKFAPISEEQAT